MKMFNFSNVVHDDLCTNFHQWKVIFKKKILGIILKIPHKNY